MQTFKLEMIKDPEVRKRLFILLSRHSDDKVFEHLPIRLLVEHGWHYAQPEVMKYVLLPFLLVLISFNLLMYIGLPEWLEEDGRSHNGHWSVYLCVIPIVLALYLFYKEVRQANTDY